ncbi:RNA polymerase sigma factor SigF, partial [Actinoplanes sp. NPDC051475]
MTATAIRATTASDSTTESAADLLHAMAEAPAGDRCRAVLRDRAIEAWLPLARHLAHRYSGRGEPTDDLV